MSNAHHDAASTAPLTCFVCCRRLLLFCSQIQRVITMARGRVALSEDLEDWDHIYEDVLDADKGKYQHKVRAFISSSFVIDAVGESAQPP